MTVKLSTALFALLLILGGCAQTDTSSYNAPERGDPAFLEGMNTRADELYLNSEVPAGGRDFRNVYIAPVDLSHLQIIQPEGTSVDEQWKVNAAEQAVLQQTINDEFAMALSYQSAFNIVDSVDEAQIVVNTTVVAIHPNATRAAVATGAKRGGAITVSIALVHAGSGDVMVRSVDTKSSDDIWAFNQVENDDSAVALIFRSWGNSMRRGILYLQARSNDPLAPPIMTTEQK